MDETARPKIASAGERRAECACGQLSVIARGEPTDVYACSCTACQKKSGGVFTYVALYPEPAVTVSGEYRTWRHTGDSGRIIENRFCPTCGVTVFFRSEGLPGVVGVAAGCFSDPEFARPARLYWASRKHRWLVLGEIREVDTQ